MKVNQPRHGTIMPCDTYGFKTILSRSGRAALRGELMPHKYYPGDIDTRYYPGITEDETAAPSFREPHGRSPQLLYARFHPGDLRADRAADHPAHQRQRAADGGRRDVSRRLCRAGGADRRHHGLPGLDAD